MLVLQLTSGKQVGREKMGSEGETSEKKKKNGERIHVLIKGIRDSTPNIVSTCTNTSQTSSSSIILALSNL